MFYLDKKKSEKKNGKAIQIYQPFLSCHVQVALVYLGNRLTSKIDLSNLAEKKSPSVDPSEEGLGYQWKMPKNIKVIIERYQPSRCLFFLGGGPGLTPFFWGSKLLKTTLFGKREVEVCSLLFVESVAFDHRMFFTVLALFQF